MAKRPCARAGCASLVVSGYCEGCKAKGAERETRPNAAARGYGRTWQEQRAWYLRAHPWCVDPYGTHGQRLEAATVVDHIVPHKGDSALFRDPANRQGLCKRCHDRKTVLEDGGFGRKPPGMKGVGGR